MNPPLVVIAAVACLGLATSTAFAEAPARKIFGKDKPFKTEELPAGKLKSKLQSISPQARGKAMKWLHTFTFEEFDAVHHLRADDGGGIYYECPDSQGNCDGHHHGPVKPGAAKHSPAESKIATESAPIIPTEPAPVIAAAPVAVSAPPVYNSRPGATRHIYLDFNGAYVTGKAWAQTDGVTTWNTWDCDAWSSDADKATFSDAEQADIRRIWERISEDYAPFDINVTTDTTYDPVNYTGDKNKVGWLLFTNTTDKNGARCPHFGSGGVAYIGVFGDSNFFSTYQPAWVLPGEAANMAEAGSHEIGHNMGLRHDGTAAPAVYYNGHAATASAPSWAPIMGTGYGRNVSQWSKGEYYNSAYITGESPNYVVNANTQNDLSVISSRVPYRTDDHGGTFAAATVWSNSSFNQQGVVERTNDADYFKFLTGNGVVTINANGYKCDTGTWGGNLDITLELYNESQQLVASNNVADNTNASISLTVPAGNYYLVVKPSATGSPMSNPPSGHTVYGSLGQYTITGNAAPQDTVIVSSPNGSENWSRGSTQTITWGSAIGGNVKIELFKNGVFHSTIAASTPNDGSHAWTIPSNLTPDINYRIRISSVENPAKTDESFADFTISPAPLYYASMNTNPGWTLGTGWAYGTPTGSNQDGYGNPDPGSGFNGTSVIGYQLAGDYEASLTSTRWATTPAFNCTGHQNVKLNFWRWLGVEGGYDNAYIEVSNNGTTWTKVWENSNAFNVNDDDGSWVNVEYDISAVANNQPNVYIRWGMGTTDNSWNYSGWNLDEVKVSGTLINNPGVVITQSGGATQVTEGGATDTYTVKLLSQPSANVTVNISPVSQVSVSSASLTFTTANWNTEQTVTVTAINDSVYELSQSGIINHTTVSTDANYHGISVDGVSVQITDNDNLPPTVNAGTDQTVSLSVNDSWTPGITYHPITNDQDCGISSSKVYTHALDFGLDATRALINGVQFQAGGTTFGSIAGTSATVGTGTTTIATAHAGNSNAAAYLNGTAGCNMEGLVKDMNYGASNGIITLTGLTPGVHYQFRLYNRAWGTAAATRSQNIGFETNGAGTTIAAAEYISSFSEDNATQPAAGFATFSQVNALTLDYTLPAGVTSLKVYVNQITGGTYHLYGLTNEQVAQTEGAIVNLDGTVSNLEASDTVTTTWSMLSGPSGATANFSNPNAVDTTVSFAQAGIYVLRLTANDGFSTTTDDVTVTVNSTATNTAPVANSSSATTNEDTPVPVVLTATDAESNPLTYTVVNAPTKGTLSGTAPNLTYTPNANANGSDSFTFKANDGTADSIAATVNLTVNPVNDVPVASGGTATTNEDTAVAITLVASDVETAVTYTVVSAPTKGTLSGTAPNLTYTPNANANGSDSFTFKVNDGIVDSIVATVSIAVTPVNDVPSVSNSSATTDEDTAVAVTLVASDVETAVTYTVVTAPKKGTLSGTAPNLTYTPNANTSGSDSFTFKVSDGTVDSIVATVSLTVNAVNDAPVVEAGNSQTLALASGFVWEAYHDLGAATGSGSTGNITTHQSGASTNSTNALDVSSKSLIKYSDGSSTGVSLSIAGANAMDSRTNVIAAPSAGTPASALFTVAGLNLSNGCIYEGGTNGSGATTITITGLNPGELYDFAIYGDRSSTADGVERFTLGGADSATNASTIGIVNNLVADMETRPNGTAGNMARWKNINPGADGIITVSIDPEAAGNLSNIAYLSAVRLAQQTPSPTVATLDGTVSDVEGAVTTNWSVVSAPAGATVVFGDAAAVDTTASFTTAGDYTLRLTADDTVIQTYDEVTVTVTGLPLPWLSTDVGTGMLAGSDNINSPGYFIEVGSGVIGGTSDKMHFAYQMLSGDGEITARIRSLQNTGASSSVGVMIRDSLASNSKQVFMGMNGSNAYHFSNRESIGGTTSVTSSGVGTVPNTWVRLVRSGTTVSAYKSADGITWTLTGTATNTTIGANCYIGLVVASGSDTTLNTSQFNNVSVTP